MKIRIHFAVGSAAIAKTVDINESFRGFCNTAERCRRDDVILRFTGPGATFAVAARSIVLVEEVS